MTVSCDQAIVFTAFAGFICYLIVQLTIFRFISSRRIIKGLLFIFFLGAVVDITAGVYVFFVLDLKNSFGLPMLLLLLICSLGIYGLLCFLYVLYIYGPYESSIRIRILREFTDVYPKGLKREELLRNYNDEKILRTRLDRLVGSGDIVNREGRLWIGSQRSIFLMMERIAQFLRRVIRMG